MAQCPKCGAQLNADFGMVVCAICKSLSVIDMDGNVQIDGSGSDGPPAAISADFGNSEPAAEAPVFDPLSESAVFAPEPLPEQAAELEYLREAEAGDLSAVADFGNSPDSFVRDGLYAFDVKVAGIDSRELRAAVRAALEDERFAWDVEQIMGSISLGTLRLPRLNPVKASIVVNRLKGSSLEIHWRQINLVEA